MLARKPNLLNLLVILALILPGGAQPIQAQTQPVDNQAIETQSTGITTRVSVASDGAQGNLNSYWPSASADGRYVSFTSYANNLVDGDTNGALDVFVYDRQTGQTTRVSVATDGTEGNFASYRPHISDDGRYVVFESEASNLVSGDTNARPDIFAHDRQTGQTTRVSVASDGTQGNGYSVQPFISASGRYVTFTSNSTNWSYRYPNPLHDIYLHDMQAGQTTLISKAFDGAYSNLDSLSSSISANGRFVAFDSRGSNLVPGDTNGTEDVFVYDRQADQTTRVSIASDGTQANGHSGSVMTGIVVPPSISADGRYVAFESDASNLVAGDTNNRRDVFVHDLQTGQTTRISVASDGTQANDSSGFPSTSSDGRYVVFVSHASNLVVGDTNQCGNYNCSDIFVHDRQTGQTNRVSVASDGAQANWNSSFSSISSDGRYIVFDSGASNLVSGDTNDVSDIFVYIRGGVQTATAIAAGHWHTCVLTSGGGVKCWGGNGNGQLGDGTATRRLTPVIVSGLTSGITAIATGFAHTCALTAGGGVKCWGDNSWSQLGDGTSTGRLTPVNVSGLTSGVVAVATGEAHTCALTIGGGVKCWGANFSGQLGDGTTINRLTPVNVSGLTSGVAAIATGSSHTCALTTGGGVKCWGQGPLGDGTTTNRLVPVDVNGLDFIRVIALTTGLRHTCVLTSEGRAMCWGQNSDGQLGDGTTTESLFPVEVSGLSNGVTKLTAGDQHTCALISGGGVKCWGWNSYGQLGDGTTTNRLAPVNVSGLSSGMTALVAGNFHTCALTSGGGVKCWGGNVVGNLGDGTTTQRLTPVDVVGFAPTYSISGQVKDGNGSPVTGVTVSDSMGHSDTTGTSGNYTISYVPSGTYVIKAGKGNYTFSPSSRTVNVSSADVPGQDFTVRKPPLVLVHGFLGLADYSDTCGSANNPTPYHYSADPNRNEPANIDTQSASRWLDLKNRDYFAQAPERFHNDGYDVWVAHVASGPTRDDHPDPETPSLYVNAQCLTNQLAQIYQDNPQRVIIVSHSMGGPVGRACVSRNYGGCRDKVSQLFTLGSPHAGLPPGEIWWYSFKPEAQPGLLELSADGMKVFNNLNANRSGKIYMFLGGDGRGGEYDIPVSKYSAVGWINKKGDLDPPGWDSPSVPSRFWTDEFHDEYFRDRAGVASHAYQCIMWFLGKSSNFCRTATPAATTAEIQPQAEPTSIQTTPFLQASLTTGNTASHTIQVDTTGNSSFKLKWATGNLSLTLVRPGGQIIDPAYANANPNSVKYSFVPSGPGSLSQITYSFTNTLPGLWQLNISNIGTSTTDYMTFAEFETSRTLTVTANSDTLSVGSNLALTATLSNGATAIPGATVTAQINRSDNITDTVILAHQGNGIYVANYLVPNAPGYLPVSITATGSDGGTAFERQELLMLAIAPQTAQLTGSYSDSAVDDDADGLFDSLNIQVGVNPSVSSDFTLSGDLVVGSQLVAHAGAYVSLTPGAQNVTLSFSGDDIRTANLNGPYTLTNLTLSDMTYGSIPVASVTNVYTTSAYTAADFAATCYTLNLAANPPSGGTLTPNIVPNCNSGTQYASGSAVMLTSTANAGYNFAGWSGDANGATNPLAVTVDDDKTAIADFSASLGAPSLLSLPENGLTVVYSPTLDWSDLTPAPDHYEIQIATNNAFSNLVIADSVTDSTYTTIVPLAPNSKYYWRVRAFNTAGQFSPWSAVRSFRTALLSPESSFPSGLSQPASLRPLFDWGNVSGASSYNLQISTSQNFTTLVLNMNVSASAYVPMVDLPKGTLLFWRVRTLGTNGPSAWSRVRHFDSPNPPSVPNLLTPAHNATVANGQPTLDWSDSSPGVDHYEVQLSAHPFFVASLGRGRGGRTATSQYTVESALGTGTYYWRVRAVNGQGQFSQWSAGRRFSVP